MELGAATHPGLVRQGNEDGFFASREQAVFAVADGMGGHQHGEVASHLALEAIAHDAEKLSTATPNELASDLYTTVQSANTSIFTQAESQEARNRMGTTLVLATICGDRLYFAHIGDSRLYLLRDEVFTQLTRDHSLVQTLVDRGEISQDEAAIHPLRHQITRVVGGDERVSPDIASQALLPGDIILLCTDGLSGAVSADEIKAILRTKASAQQKSDALIAAALQAGGPDNITAVVVRYQQPRSLSPTVRTDKHATRHLSFWQAMLLSLLALVILVAGIEGWQYTHPDYLIATDTHGVLTVYQEWPFLPMLARQRVPAPDTVAVTMVEAKPYLTQYQPADGDLARGIQVENKDAGIALLNDLARSTAAGMLENARKALVTHDLPQAEFYLARARALRADPAMIKQLEEQIRVQEKPLKNSLEKQLRWQTSAESQSSPSPHLY